MEVRKLIFIVGLLFLVGCAIAPPVTPEKFLENKRRQLIKEGNAIDFIDGYIDGCSSGKHIIAEREYHLQKDKSRYQINRDYSIGWEQGYYSCRDEDIAKLQQEVQQEYIPADTVEEELERAKIWEELKK